MSSGTNLTMKESTCSHGAKPPKNVQISKNLPVATNLTINKEDK
jgi:hypothetical protein